MIWLWILGILAALILLLCLTRVGARAELRRDGVTLDAKIGPFHIRILPAKETPEKKKKPEKKAKKPEKAGEEKPKKSLPKIALADIKDAVHTLAPPLKRALGRTRRGIRVQPLRLSVTVGMQASCQFAGNREMYATGNMFLSEKSKATLKTFWKAFLPSGGSSGSNIGDKAYYEGNHLGSWDLAVRYRLDGGKRLRAYYQSPFEDGSGIGKLNGWDGLYGLEYRTADRSPVSGAVVAYLDLMNHSGPIHWAPGDFPGTPIVDQATGGDNYYNNYYFNGYSELGMSIGSPMLKSTIYNRDGYQQFTDNRLRGFHAAVTGYVLPELSYRLMASYRKSCGSVFVPAIEKRDATSVMVEGSYDAHKLLPGLSITAQVAVDRGSLYGNNVGAVVAVKYCGRIGK